MNKEQQKSLVQDTLSNIDLKSKSKVISEIQENSDNVPDLIIKNNRGQVISKNGKLKIKSVGNEPIIKIEPVKPKSKDPKRTEADKKRIQSMIEMKRGYQQQKSLIQASLSKIDFKSKSKVIFDAENADGEIDAISNNTKQTLFDDDDDDEGDGQDYNFEVKDQFQGERGQKLLKLQSRYKRDKRFTLDERFLDDENEYINGEEEQTVEYNEKSDEISPEEKDKQIAILEEVLGKKVKTRSTDNTNKKIMLRFDPNQPEHLKYEVKEQVVDKKRKRKESKEETEENKNDEKPIVSKDTFYKVTDDLKDALQEKESFSLLSTFGKSTEKDSNASIEKQSNLEESIEKPMLSKENPFRYDSTDEETDDEVTENKKPEEESSRNEIRSQNVKLGSSRLWTEPFFFQFDDFRLQDGIDFIKRMEIDDKSEFLQVRRNLKQITLAKVRNNQRKNKPFRKKLGGNKRMLKVKKAIKR